MELFVTTDLQNDLEQIEINLLLEAIYQRYGYDFRSYARSSVRRRVRHLLSKLNLDSALDLLGPVLKDETLARKAIFEFSITVTEMFRDPDFFRSVREQVFPYLHTYPYPKIWAAGCATGEEVYSLAILLQEDGLYERCTIFATDFNDEVLDRAREGVFTLKEMRQYTENYVRAGGKNAFSEYYHANYEFARMPDHLKKNITFANHNLVTDNVFGEMHLIFCRNVLIYFERPLQNRVLRLFSDSLRLGGFLCLGNKETLGFSDVAHSFKEVDDKQKIYQKKLR
jgi:chemotaxis protein methyltransferase CheR